MAGRRVQLLMALAALVALIASTATVAALWQTDASANGWVGNQSQPGQDLIIDGSSSGQALGVTGDVIVLSSDGTLLFVDINGGIVTFDLASVSALVIGGGAGDDQFTVDFTAGGSPIPSGGLTIQGHSQMTAAGDVLTIIGTFSDQTITHTPPSADGNNGTIGLDGGTITYTGLEPINAGNSADTTVNLPTGLFNTATLLNSVNSGEVEILDNGATFEDTVIPNPTNSLTINLGDQGDTLTVGPLDASYAASLIVNGGLGIDDVDMTNVDLINTPGRGLHVTETENLSISGGTISGNTATSGAGIQIDGATGATPTTATITAATVSGNTASVGDGGGIMTNGDVTLSIQDTTFTGNSAAGYGGGIYNGSSLTVNDSTVSGGSADYGAGIASGASLTLTASTVHNNTASEQGGGLHSIGTTTVANSTISGNTATVSGGGVHNQDGTVTVVFSTITDNDAPAGSGISAFGDNQTFTTVSASIVADNTDGDDVSLFPGTLDFFESGSFNVIGSIDPNIAAFGGPTSDLVGQSNLGLLPLGLTGTGSTETHGLDAGSMAIDRVTGTITAGTDQGVDQNGTNRPQGANKDAGALEAVGVPAALCDGKLVTINLGTNGGNGTGTGGIDIILGTDGDDTINGFADADTICAGAGQDIIRGGAGDDTIFGEEGIDTIRGGGGDDTIDGGPAGDTIFGQGGQDTIQGGGGDDTINGQGAGDTIDGGGGNDTINGQNGGDSLKGSSGHDTIRGNTGPDDFDGDAGDDDLGGGEGADTLHGGPGIDKCAGNTGPDQAHAATCETTPGVEVLF